MNVSADLGYVEILGAVLAAALLLQLSLTLYGTWRNTVALHRQHTLSLERLRADVVTARLRSKLTEHRERLTWNGTRKFRVRRKIKESGDICSFELVPHDGKMLPPFEAGQYLTFHLDIPGESEPAVRCYSLSESPFVHDYYRVTIKRIPPPRDQPDAPPGLASSFMHDDLNEGDILDVGAPSGEFFLDTSKHTGVVLIGGGVGITPVLSMLNAICHSDSRRETHFFYGVVSSRDHIMRDHLNDLARENDYVHLHVCYSHPTEECVLGQDHDHAEHVSVDLFKRVLGSNNYEYYICGPPPMMTALTTDLAKWGVPDVRVHFEAFGPASVAAATQAPETGDAAAEDGPSYELDFVKSGKKIRWTPSAGTILEFGKRNGIRMRSGCCAGSCGTCIMAIMSGEVKHLKESGATHPDGTCLVCISVPLSDLSLDA